jgi:type IV pilus assembly protein PilA
VLRNVRRERGFTLIEMMIVVALVTVLALVAGVAYRRWVRSSYLGEAEDMLSNIRMAEETFRSENGTYLATASSLSTLYPSTTPSEAIKTQWGTNAGAWATLNVMPSAPLWFGYSVIASPPGQLVPAAPAEIIVNGQPANYASLGGQPWFIAEAQCDLDNDATTSPTTLYASSGSNRLLVANEGQ